MSGTFILIVVMVVIVILSKYSIAERQRVEQHKKFMRDMENFDKKNYKK